MEHIAAQFEKYMDKKYAFKSCDNNLIIVLEIPNDANTTTGKSDVVDVDNATHFSDKLMVVDIIDKRNTWNAPDHIETGFSGLQSQFTKGCMVRAPYFCKFLQSVPGIPYFLNPEAAFHYESGARWENGRIRIQKIGNVITLYSENGAKLSEIAYNNVQFRGTNVQRHGTFMQYHGPFMQWYEDGAQKHKGEYVNGEKEGVHISWSNNGTKSFEGKFINGKQNDIHIYWYDNEQKQFEGLFTNDKRVGLHTCWFKHGQKKKEVVFTNNKKTGDYIEWYKNGQIKYEKYYIDDKREGYWYHWDNKGTVLHDEKGFISYLSVDYIKNTTRNDNDNFYLHDNNMYIQ